MIVDHRGQGGPAGCLTIHTAVTSHFDEYVEDFERFYQLEIAPRQYEKKVRAGTFSMGGNSGCMRRTRKAS